MQPYTLEQNILEGEIEVKDLFKYISASAQDMEAYEIEKEIFKRVMQIGLTAMKGYFAVQGTGDIGENFKIDNEVILLKDNRKLYERDYFSIFGKVKVPRTCYRKEGHEGIMPLDAMVNFPERCYSYLLQELMDLCSIRESFEESSETLQKNLGLDIKKSRFETIGRESINSYDVFYQNKDIPASESEDDIQVVGFDGKGVPVIKSESAKLKGRLGKGEKRQKKKEAIVGVSYTTTQNERTSEEVALNLIYPEKAKEDEKDGEQKTAIKAQNIRRMASLERPKQEVMQEIIEDALKRIQGNNKKIVVVMDGALCLWNLVSLLLVGLKWVGILDIIHVSEYLWNVGNAMYGEKTLEAKKWVYDNLLLILKGNVYRVFLNLDKLLLSSNLKKSQIKSIMDATTYFENHYQWMRYDEYLRAGYPIGSGVVESTCSHTVKDRMEGTGRRWSIDGAESILLLRSVYTSGDWDEYWKTNRALIKSKLYKNVLDGIQYTDDYNMKKVANG